MSQNLEGKKVNENKQEARKHTTRSHMIRRSNVQRLVRIILYIATQKTGGLDAHTQTYTHINTQHNKPMQGNAGKRLKRHEDSLAHTHI